MSYSLDRDDKDTNPVDGERPLVPVGVLEGIENIKNGNTASTEDIESVLKF